MSLADLINFLRADLLRLNEPNQKDNKNSVNWLKVFNPRFHPVIIARIARYTYLSPIFKFISPLFTWLNVIIYGIEITPRCEVGPGLLLPHSIGTVIGASYIGKNATIFQGVTIGAVELDLNFDINLRPILGDNVMVGAGAKLLGGIRIGDNSKVGANAVVLKSVPENNIAIGIPAKTLPINKSNQ